MMHIFAKLLVLSFLINGRVSGEVIKQQRVGIIGAGGYIGSTLHDFLSGMDAYDVVGYDRDPHIPKRHGLIHLASHEIPTAELHSFQVIIYLGGFSARDACDKHSAGRVYRENVLDPVNLALRLGSHQLFLFALSAATAEGSNVLHKEDDAVRESELDSYSRSMFKREKSFRSLVYAGALQPKLIGIRMGTVSGVSRVQRVDLMYTSLMSSAYTTGLVHVRNGHMAKAILWLQDLKSAVLQILKESDRVDRGLLHTFNLVSFNTYVGAIANSVAGYTGARVVEARSDSERRSGYMLDGTKFARIFDFEMHGTQLDVMNEIETHLPRSIIGGNVGIPSTTDSIPCPVCGSHHLQEVLDLHEQPLANDFQLTSSAAVDTPRFPLKLMRCKVCNHMHLSNAVNRTALFSHYLYSSNTSRTLLEYFAWLAQKVSQQIGPETRKNVLELACNDGSQLDEFSKLGWKTFGVDAAANLAAVAREKGHVVWTGFWGVDEFPKSPRGADLTAIVAQNVLAHVPDPVGFLRACSQVMGPSTRLYVQTSQCQMHQETQYDTAYHEHISFFTGHSFHKAAELSGLWIENFETTPIHGVSCLVTFRLKLPTDPPLSPPLAGRIDQEVADGLTSDFFYVKYRRRAEAMRDWLHRQLRALHTSGYQIVAYGAAAKGMTLLHFLLQKVDASYQISVVLDDAPLKQGRFCPGTPIPVRPTSYLQHDDLAGKPLAVLVLAWNFWDEIAQKLRGHLMGRRTSIPCLLPFPMPRLVNLRISSTEQARTVLSMPFRPAAPFKSRRRRVMLLSHFYNEALLLPFWIRHHAPMFDYAVLIDYNSTDDSREIIKRQAPPTWRVVPSVDPDFDAATADKQIMMYELEHPDDWHLALTVTEFVVHSDLRRMLSTLDPPEGESRVLQFPAVHMFGDDTQHFQYFGSLLEQRSVYMGSDSARSFETLYSRFIHTGLMSRNPPYYKPGRHGMNTLSNAVPYGFIAKFMFTPWPEIIARKVQIGARVSQLDKSNSRHSQHHVRWGNQSLLEADRAEVLRRVAPRDLKNICYLMTAKGLVSRIHTTYHHAVDPLYPYFTSQCQ